MSEISDVPPRYLGDGVYAHFDGWHIWLGLQAGQRGIALEPAVLAALIDYDSAIRRHYAAQSRATNNQEES
jgi:hypothetical protein